MSNYEGVTGQGFLAWEKGNTDIRLMRLSQISEVLNYKWKFRCE